MTTISKRKKYSAPPPIFIPGVENMKPLVITIEGIIRRRNYTMKIVNNDTLKIQTIELEKPIAVLDILKQTRWSFIQTIKEHIN
jgi:hypothetical protein